MIVPMHPPPNFLAPQPAINVLNNPFMIVCFKGLWFDINLHLIKRSTFRLGRNQNRNPSILLQ